jgi:hypothetical protein
MDQPVPKVDDADVERIVRRDFPPAEQSSVMEILARYGESDGMIPPPRVRLAILKLSGRDSQKVERYVADALIDSRDVVTWAEYSRYERTSGTKSEKRSIEDDWNEYKNWLDAKANQ